MHIEKYCHIKNLGAGGDNKIYTEIDFDIKEKKLVNFCIIQFHIKKNKKQQIVRIDTAHEKPHIHKFYTQDNIVEKFEDEISPQVYEKAKQFIYSNWKTFLGIYKRKDLK